MLPGAARAGKVDFGPDGACRIDGKPFFPIGVWVYGLDPDVMADLHEHRFNTITGNGIKPTDVSMIEKHGLMCIPPGGDDFVKAFKDSPSLLAWYLEDEPEEHNVDPGELRKKFDAMKEKGGPSHPVGVTHDQLIGPSRYKGSSDFTFTDVYPVTRLRDWPLNAVGQYTANTRAVNGPSWPTFTFIQTFGGPDSDGGKWAQPLPYEVRFMVFNALVHRANGIFYFSYWPRAPITWASVATLNREIAQLTPRLLAPGEEMTAQSSDAAIEVRAKKIAPRGWMIIATNSSPRPIRTIIKVEQMGDEIIHAAGEAEMRRNAKAGQWSDNFAAHEAKVYLSGDEPALE